ALAAAALIVLKFFVTIIVLGSATGDPSYSAALVVEIAEYVALAIAFWFLHRWFRGIDARLSVIALAAGLAGVGMATAGDLVELAGAPLTDTALLVVILAAQVGVAAWLLLAGTLVGRSTSALGRSGWLGQLGGVGYLLIAGEYLAETAAPEATVVSAITAFAPFLVLFGVAFFFRLGRFAATGRLAQGPI
ncbi:MAG: hypothetical protein ACREBE_20570, partial [bacterium]